MEGRDEQGRFQPGNGYGGKSPGRPRRSVEVEYLRALSDEVTIDDWKDIVAAAKEQAKAGDAKAREWLASFVIGKEPPATLRDLALMDIHEATVDDLLDAKANEVEYFGRGLAGEAVEGKRKRVEREARLAELQAKREKREAAKRKRQPTNPDYAYELAASVRARRAEEANQSEGAE